MANDVPPTVLTGEIEPAGRTRRYNYTATLDEDTVAKVIQDRIGRGLALRVVAERYGISIETVRNWCNQGTASQKHTAADIIGVRAKIFLRLDLLIKECQDVMVEAREQVPQTKETRRTALDAVAQIKDCLRQQAILSGANAPTNIDLSITQETEQDRELRDMINTAKAKAAADEARVIADASADPDL